MVSNINMACWKIHYVLFGAFPIETTMKLVDFRLPPIPSSMGWLEGKSYPETIDVPLISMELSCMFSLKPIKLTSGFPITIAHGSVNHRTQQELFSSSMASSSQTLSNYQRDLPCLLCTSCDLSIYIYICMYICIYVHI